MSKKSNLFLLVALALLVVISFGSCATILNNKQTTITSSSGASKEVTILENGSVVYQGNLPATINVNGSNNYSIQYKDKDGNARTLQLQKKISGWFIADVILVGGWIIDLITGDVMVYEKSTTLPISYKKGYDIEFVNSLTENERSEFTVIGNIYR